MSQYTFLADNIHQTNHKPFFLKRLRSKYGPQIFDDLLDLKINNDCILSNLAQKYNFSREYARQLFAKYHGVPYTHFYKQKTLARQKKAEIARETQYTLLPIQKRLLQKCTKLSLTFHKVKGRIFVNGYSILLRECTKPYRNNKHFDYYRFNLGAPAEKVHFVICYAQPIDTYYVLPARGIQHMARLYLNTKICEGHYITKANIFPYPKYREAWDQLRHPITTG